jgi:hypothetical protein
LLCLFPHSNKDLIIIVIINIIYSLSWNNEFRSFA